MPGTARTAILCAALAAFSCIAGAASAQPFRLITTDLAPPLVPNSVMHMADELGYFEREGVEVELIGVQQTPSAIAALQAGEGDMANISVDAALQLVARDQMDLKAVISPNKSLPFLIAGTESIGDLPDLEGMSFGVGRVGSLDHSLSTAVLEAHGVDTSTIDFVNIGQPNVRAQALAAGQIDATTMSIGVWLSLDDTSGLEIFVDQDAYYAAAPVINKVNVVTDETLEAKRDQVQAVVTAIIKASRDFAASPELWVDAMAEARPDVSREDLEQLAEAFVSSWSVNGGLNSEELQGTVEWTYESPDFQDLRPVSLDEWVDFSFIETALESEGVASDYDPPSF
jgi:NitT/TauT family transport system substrate-binding protein